MDGNIGREEREAYNWSRAKVMGKGYSFPKLEVDDDAEVLGDSARCTSNAVPT